MVFGGFELLDFEVVSDKNPSVPVDATNLCLRCFIPHQKRPEAAAPAAVKRRCANIPPPRGDGARVTYIFRFFFVEIQCFSLKLSQ